MAGRGDRDREGPGERQRAVRGSGRSGYGPRRSDRPPGARGARRGRAARADEQHLHYAPPRRPTRAGRGALLGDRAGGAVAAPQHPPPAAQARDLVQPVLRLHLPLQPRVPRHTTRRSSQSRSLAARQGTRAARGPSTGGVAGLTRVALVAGTYRPERCGVAHYTERLRSALDERGVSSLVLTTGEAARASSDPYVRGVVRGWGLSDLPALVRAVRGAVRDEGADVVHVQHAAGTYGFKRAVFFLPPLLRAAGCHAPLVTTLHEYGWGEWEPRGVPKGAIEALKTWGQRRGRWDREDGFLLTGSDTLITTNYHAESAIVERLPWLAPRVRRIPLVANVDVAPLELDEARNEVRARYGWPREAEIIVYFGFLHPVKGMEVLLKAYRGVLEKRPHARLLLVGGVESLALGDEAGWYWNKLRALVGELGLDGSVGMTGYVSEEEASRLLSGVDVGVLPFNEGVTLKSGTLLTLFAHGLPVVATRPEPPEPDLVDGQLVRLVEQRDVAGLSAVLSDLLGDPSMRTRLGAAGRAYAGNLSWPETAERHLEVYRSVLKGVAAPMGGTPTATRPASRSRG